MGTDSTMFFGRKKELGILEEMYSKGSYSTCMVTGRRRIGKSELIKEFCKGKRNLRIQFEPGIEEDQLSNISNAMNAAFGGDNEFDSIQKAIDAIGVLCRQEKTIVVFDELPYLLESIPNVAGKIQHFIDMTLSQTASMLIVCGSIMSVMKGETADATKPLYGRFDREIELGPLSIEECRGFHPGLSDMELVDLYLIFGGIPKFHRLMSGRPYSEILEDVIMDAEWMQTEADIIIDTELDKPGPHKSIIAAVASGSTSRSEIIGATNLSETTCGEYLQELVRIDVLGTRTPMLGASQRKSYLIRDPITAFYYEVVRRARTLLAYQDRRFVAEAMKQDMATFLGKRFELFCMDYMMRNYPCKAIGSWWGKADGEIADIDIVATVLDANMRQRLVLCECKHRSKERSWSDLTEMADIAKKINGVIDPTYALISWSGFKESLVEDAPEYDVVLIGVDNLTGRIPAPGLPDRPSRL